MCGFCQPRLTLVSAASLIGNKVNYRGGHRYRESRSYRITPGARGTVERPGLRVAILLCVGDRHFAARDATRPRENCSPSDLASGMSWLRIVCMTPQ